MQQLNNHLNMATRETAAADINVNGQRRCNRATAMAARKGRRDTSGEQTNSKGRQAGNGDACDSD